MVFALKDALVLNLLDAVQREIVHLRGKILISQNELRQEENKQRMTARKRTENEFALSKMAEEAADLVKKQQERKAKIGEMAKQIGQKTVIALAESKQAVYGGGKNAK